MTEVLTSKSGCYPKETLGEGRTLGFNVTIENQGGYQETFNVTLFANATYVNSTEVVLLDGESANVTLFLNTTGWLKGTYQIQVDAVTISQETDTIDNLRFYGGIMVTISGDVDGDRDVDIFDVVHMTVNYSCSIPDLCYDLNSDIDSDGDIDIFDVVATCVKYGESW